MSHFWVSPSCCKCLLLGGGWKQMAVINRQPKPKPKPKPLMIKAQMINPSTFSSRISSEVPLYEVPGATFDQYLEDKPRVFRALFPDKQKSQQLNEEDQWRIEMPPLTLMFTTLKPVIDIRLRCKSQGIAYPSGVPHDITNLVEYETIRWELEGLNDVLSHLSAEAEGVIYPDRRGPRTKLKSRLQINISFVLPPMLSLIPEHVHRELMQSVLRSVVENMKSDMYRSLLADYSSFKREKSIYSV